VKTVREGALSGIGQKSSINRLSELEIITFIQKTFDPRFFLNLILTIARKNNTAKNFTLGKCHIVIAKLIRTNQLYSGNSQFYLNHFNLMKLGGSLGNVQQKKQKKQKTITIN
jgi:hypothetical protein